MKKLSILLVVISISIVSCKNMKKNPETTKNKPYNIDNTYDKVISISLTPKSESTVTGTVVFTEKDGLVSMTANITGLKPGEHAIHIHESSDCSSPDGKSTGGHWNPTNQPHGKWGVETGYHKGDIGNFIADEEGNGSIAMSTTEWCLDCDDVNKNIIGKAIIVHAGIDDFKTQPTGDAGGRISCGGIIE